MTQQPDPCMNIYLLRLHEHGGYDSYDAHVVRAVGEREARAAVPCGDERLCGPGFGSVPDEYNPWLHANASTCTLLAVNVTGDAAVILSSFNAG